MLGNKSKFGFSWWQKRVCAICVAAWTKNFKLVKMRPITNDTSRQKLKCFFVWFYSNVVLFGVGKLHLTLKYSILSNSIINKCINPDWNNSYIVSFTFNWNVLTDYQFFFPLTLQFTDAKLSNIQSTRFSLSSQSVDVSKKQIKGDSLQ